MLEFQTKPLEMSRRLLTWLYLYPSTETSGNQKSVTCFAFTIAVYVATMSFLVSSMAFFMKFVSTDLEESLYALFQIGGFSNTAYVITFAYFSHRRIAAIVDELTAIYNTCKNSFFASKSEIIWNKFYWRKFNFSIEMKIKTAPLIAIWSKQMKTANGLGCFTSNLVRLHL